MEENQTALSESVDSPSTDSALPSDSHTETAVENPVYESADDVFTEPVNLPKPEVEDKDPPEGDKVEKPHEKAVPYDRFKEVNDKVTEFDKKLADMTSKHEASEKRAQELANELRLRTNVKAPEKKPSLLDLPTDEFMERFEEEGPSLLKQLLSEHREALLSETKAATAEQANWNKAAEIFESYAKEHEDFRPMVEDGTIAKFQEENPLVTGNVITFHRIISQQKQIEELTASIDEKVKAAKEEAKKELLKIKKAKDGSEVKAGGSKPVPQGGNQPTKFKSKEERHNYLTNLLIKSRNSHAA